MEHSWLSILKTSFLIGLGLWVLVRIAMACRTGVLRVGGDWGPEKIERTTQPFSFWITIAFGVLAAAWLIVHGAGRGDLVEKVVEFLP